MPPEDLPARAQALCRPVFPPVLLVRMAPSQVGAPTDVRAVVVSVVTTSVALAEVHSRQLYSEALLLFPRMFPIAPFPVMLMISRLRQQHCPVVPAALRLPSPVAKFLPVDATVTALLVEAHFLVPMRLHSPRTAMRAPYLQASPAALVKLVSPSLVLLPRSPLAGPLPHLLVLVHSPHLHHPHPQNSDASPDMVSGRG